MWISGPRDFLPLPPLLIYINVISESEYGHLRTFDHLTLSQIFCFSLSIESEKENIARIANAVQCHNLLSDYKDCHEFRFSIVRIVISVTNPRIVFIAVVVSKI